MIIKKQYFTILGLIIASVIFASNAFGFKLYEKKIEGKKGETVSFEIINILDKNITIRAETTGDCAGHISVFPKIATVKPQERQTFKLRPDAICEGRFYMVYESGSAETAEVDSAQASIQETLAQMSESTGVSISPIFRVGVPITIQ